MRWYLVFFLFIFSELKSLEPISYLGTQLQKAQEGDYIVTLQSGNYSLLYVQACENSQLLLQEINVPDLRINPKTINWQKWIQEDAPGHTSWLLFEIDLQEGRLLESYDTGRGEWMHLQGENHLLVKLLHLSMKPLQERERRRIGPPPPDGETDHRAVWTPPQVFENTSGKSPTVVWRADWPSDQSPLSGCRLDLYYDTKHSDFPFPISIDIQSSHYKAHVRVVKAGKQLKAPSLRIPRRCPHFLTPMIRLEKSYQIRLAKPHYYKKFQVLALAKGETPISLPYKTTAGETSEELILNFALQDLEPLLKKGCRYRIALTSPPFLEGYAESEGTFVLIN